MPGVNAAAELLDKYNEAYIQLETARNAYLGKAPGQLPPIPDIMMHALGGVSQAAMITLGAVHAAAAAGSNTEAKAAMQVQLSLLIITSIVLERIKDDIPLGCRLLLVTEVDQELRKRSLHDRLRDNSAMLLGATRDPHATRDRIIQEAKVTSIERALAELTHAFVPSSPNRSKRRLFS
ncbi:hypothetical protein WJX73_009599 [Symbiochloris irregularis]|uniref:Uncharacterized protein n=1 Tax=Symbiochloris irregularis TaxID=706552 RepID=A0AAW1NU12_9CHLO